MKYLFLTLLFGSIFSSCTKGPDETTSETQPSYLIEGQFELTDFSPADSIIVQIGAKEWTISNLEIGVNKLKIISPVESGTMILKARDADHNEVTLETLAF